MQSLFAFYCTCIYKQGTGTVHWLVDRAVCDQQTADKLLNGEYKDQQVSK